MSTIIIETERLLLKEFTVDNAPFILQLVNSEGWLKYVGDRNIKTVQQATDYLNNGPIKSYQANAFGLWLVELKADGTPIGMCGLIKRDSLDNIDIGFAFLPAYTGQGYAYEAAKKTLQYGFDQLQQEKIVAITLPTNHASINLLEKIGMKYEEAFTTKDTKEVLFIYSVNKVDI
jgi:RimJ/RimL family protein N-acetyltransferase